LVVRFLPEMQPSLGPEAPYFFEAVIGLRSREEKRRVKKKVKKGILGMVAERVKELDAMVLDQHKAAGIEGFREAVRSGRLESHPFRKTSAEALVEAALRGGGNLLRGVDLKDILDEYIDQVSEAIESGSTYPVLDDLTGDFVAEAVRAGLINPSESSTASSRYGGISADLLRRLPLFETASLSEVLDVRQALGKPLRGFRLAIASFSREIRSAAWEPGFPDEADALFREKVKPEVEKNEDEAKQNAGLAEFAWRTAYHGAAPATFGAVIGSAADLPTFAGAAAGALPFLTAAGVKAMVDRRQKLKELRGRQLFFYYRAGKMVQAKG
jgi:hypothetical protein